MIAILDIAPIHEGHVIILPKLHADSIHQIPMEIVKEVMETAQQLAKTIKKQYNAPGYSIMQNGGAFCEFGHLHFHIFPRYENDGFGWNEPDGEFECSERVAQCIREGLKEVQE